MLEPLGQRAAVSLELNSYLRSTIDPGLAPVSYRAQYSLAAFDLSIEHHLSLAHLANIGLCGSAYALLRPLIEAEVAGRWLAFCATDKQADQFKKSGFCPKPEVMLKQLEKPIRKEHRIQTLLAGDGRVLHDFTHGGLEQWERRICESGQVKASYPAAEVQGVLVIADLFASLAALGIAHGCAKIELIDQLIVRIKETRAEIESSKDYIYPKKLRQPA